MSLFTFSRCGQDVYLTPYNFKDCAPGETIEDDWEGINLLDWQQTTGLNDVVIAMQLAIGDALMFTPTLRALGKKVSLVSSYGATVLQNNPNLENIWLFPIKKDLLLGKNLVVMDHGLLHDFSGDGIDVIAQQFGLELTDHTLECYPKEENVSKYISWFKGKTLGIHNNFYTSHWDNRPLVIWQLAASSLLRTYPPRQLLEAAEIIAQTANCLMIGYPDQIMSLNEDPNVADFNWLKGYKTRVMTGITPTIDDFVALISLADVIVSCDSAALHLGAAFQTPTVGLFGPSSSYARTKYHPRVRILESSQLPCIPCWKKWDEPCQHPDEYGYGRCWQEITPRMIADEVLKAFGQKKSSR